MKEKIPKDSIEFVRVCKVSIAVKGPVMSCPSYQGGERPIAPASKRATERVTEHATDGRSTEPPVFRRFQCFSMGGKTEGGATVESG